MAQDKKAVIDKDLCTGCSVCIDECQDNALEMIDDIAVVARPENCNACGKCVDICPSEAITLK